MTPQRHALFRKHIALPQDHGSWVFILSPLLIGFFAGGTFSWAATYLIVAAMAAFLIRQPVTIAVKAYAGRRSRADLPAARFWMVVYGLLALLMLIGLAMRGFGYVFYLAVPGLLIFVWHLYLISKRSERRQAGLEVIGSGVLALAAPAALWVGTGGYSSAGWVLWFLIWFQSAASIIHAYLRLAQRELTEIPERPVLWQMGRRALMYTSFNLIVTITLAALGLLPRFIFLPYLVQWAETLRGTLRPAIQAKPVAIGLRQLGISTLFTVLFILTWKIL
ncbi:MAG: YwiC-like family protein [Anaerolineales bacterium]|nr:YwiC-like family protein [Anaerolineales bacterium]